MILKNVPSVFAGLTVSRLAVEVVTILSTDVPIIRKWQFFDFLDAMANLVNFVTGIKTSPPQDKARVLEILNTEFCEKELIPTLKLIPINSIRDELVTHTQNIYNQIKEMSIVAKRSDKTYSITGSEILWAYRNTHHGYALLNKDKDALLLHSGKIPDDLPDLVIALWHYILLKFPFMS